jgi:hypothetical protein
MKNKYKLRNIDTLKTLVEMRAKDAYKYEADISQLQNKLETLKTALCEAYRQIPFSTSEEDIKIMVNNLINEFTA